MRLGAFFIMAGFGVLVAPAGGGAQIPVSDCSGCPDMVLVRPHEDGFVMGSNQGTETEPIHEVKLEPFEVAMRKIRVSEIRHAVGSVRGDDGDVAECVSWEEAQAYVDWLRGITGRQYGLLSEAQWEYLARQGSDPQMRGPRWEWVEDCWHETYHGAPTNGRAWTEGTDCSKRVMRGGGSVAARVGIDVVDDNCRNSFRVARRLNSAERELRGRR